MGDPGTRGEAARGDVPNASAENALRCDECGAGSSGRAGGWRAYLVGGYEDEAFAAIVFCPACAERESRGSG